MKGCVHAKPAQLVWAISNHKTWIGLYWTS